MTKMISRLWKLEDGATAIEYALIAAMIAVVIVAAVTLVGVDVGNVFNSISTSFKSF